MQNNHLGKLNFRIEDVEDGTAGLILSHIRFTPLRVECLSYAMIYEMIGISSLFPELEEGLEVPGYNLITKTSEDGSVISVDIEK